MRQLATLALGILLALPAPVLAATMPAPGGAVRHVPVGVFVGGNGEVFRDGIAAYAALSGEQPGIVHTFTDWDPKPFPAERVAIIGQAGAVPLVTWEPRRWDTSQAAYRLPAVTDVLGETVAGAFDGYIRAWATAARDTGRPVYVRLGHEMNGNWYPWGRVTGNTPQEYVEMFRHVHGLFEAVGADNVRWVWSPNVLHGAQTDPAAYYPGDAYVDVVGLDGYNWGDSGLGPSWQSFGTIFSETVESVRRYAAQPLWVVETGSAESGGDKALWLRDMFRTLAMDTRFAALVYFDTVGNLDWRLRTSPEASLAFREGLATMRADTEPSLTEDPSLEPTGDVPDVIRLPEDEESTTEPVPVAPPSVPEPSTPEPTLPVPPPPTPATTPATTPTTPVAAGPVPRLLVTQLRGHDRRTRAVRVRGRTGRVAAAGTRVVVQRRIGLRWSRVASTRTAVASYAVRARLPRRVVVVRVVVTGPGGTRVSTPVRVRIR